MKTNPKVAIVSTTDLAGGAARSAHRLYRGLRAIGHPVRMRVLVCRDSDPCVSAYAEDEGAIARVARRAEAHARSWWFDRIAAPDRPGGFEIFSPDPWPPGRGALAGLEDAEVINLHWVAGFIDSRAIGALCATGRPLVLTLHDMNMFTGGCHYDADCGRFTGACSRCPQLASAAERDLSTRIQARKRIAFAAATANRVRVVAPSRWLAAEASRSAVLGGFRTEVIPYGLDLDIYAPGDRAHSRAVLGVPPEARAVLFVAHKVDNARKGMARAIEALRLLADIPGLTLISVGAGAPADLPVPHVALGEIADEARLAHAYRAADVFAIASAQDNLPNTVLEALGCGTPIVGTDIGGIPDMVRNDATGFVAPLGDARAFAAALRRILEDRALAVRLGAQARRVAEAEYGLTAQAHAYARVYAEMAE